MIAAVIALGVAVAVLAWFVLELRIRLDGMTTRFEIVRKHREDMFDAQHDVNLNLSQSISNLIETNGLIDERIGNVEASVRGQVKP